MPVLAVVPDLYLATRIAATAKVAGVELELVPRERVAARLAEIDASLVLLDLYTPDSMSLVGDMKRIAPGVPVVGFFSHVDTEIRRQALAAGADAALPRSLLVSKLTSLLAHGLEALRPREPGELRP